MTSFYYILLWTACLNIGSCLESDNNKVKSIPQLNTANEEPIKLPTNGFSNALISKDNTLWVSSNGAGVFHINGNHIEHFTVDGGLSSNKVYTIHEGDDNTIWFGADNGLMSYDGNEFEHILLPFQDTSSIWLDKVYPVINPNAVHSLATDDKGNLWIGTAGGGAYLYDGVRFESYLTEIGQKQEDSLYHNWIPFIRKDNQGDLWFASMTHGGLMKYDGKAFTQYLKSDGLSDNQVRTIYCDSSSKVWIGFNGNRDSGLTVLDGMTFKTYTVADGLCNKRIRSIYEDHEGVIWLGAGRGNMCIFKDEEFSEFRYNNKAYSDILFVVGDSDNNVYFGGGTGLWMYNGKDVVDILDI